MVKIEATATGVVIRESKLLPESKVGDDISYSDTFSFSDEYDGYNLDDLLEYAKNEVRGVLLYDQISGNEKKFIGSVKTSAKVVK